MKFLKTLTDLLGKIFESTPSIVEREVDSRIQNDNYWLATQYVQTIKEMIEDGRTNEEVNVVIRQYNSHAKHIGARELQEFATT